MKNKNEYNSKIVKKGDLILIVVILVLSAFGLYLHHDRETAQKVYVTVNGETSIYSLLENQEITLKDNANVLVIENTEVRMKYADCPDQICVRHKPISKHGEMIICLPNKVFVEVESISKNEIDN